MKPQLEIHEGGRALRLSQGAIRLDLPALWLFNHGRSEQTLDQGNGQNLIDLAKGPTDPRITSLEVDDQGVEVMLDEGYGYYDFEFLNSLLQPTTETRRLLKSGDTLPRIAYGDFLKKDAALLPWLQDFAACGVGRIDAGPTESGALFALIDRFGFVRETNYGRHFEVRTEPNPTNLAYTGLGLPPHTDNPYRAPVPTLQLLYCLENSATGGESQVVDGFAVAEALRAENSEAFAILSQIDVTFAYTGQSGVDLRATRKLIEVDGAGQITAIAYNTRSMQPLAPRPGLDLAAFYAAYQRFGQMLNDPAYLIEFRLEAGEAFLLDNCRVLHARSSFKADGHRWLQGAYADMDSLLSCMRALENAQ